MFKIYDLNYQEVSLPVDALGFGMSTPENIGLDVEFGPIIYENIYTQSTRTDKLVKRYPKGRNVNLVITVISYKDNPSDWRLKRDEVYEFFRTLGTFYIAEEKQPFKILKVIVDENYEYEKINENWARSEIALKVIDTPFKQSLHTTSEIDNEGINWDDKWAYGMGLSSDENQWRYSFNNVNPRFYNAGTEDIKLIRQKESEIKIDIKSSANWLEIDDGDTIFRLNRSVRNGDVLRIKGHTVTLNDNNILGDTNAEFLTAKKGWNDWEIINLNRYDFSIDFRFLYD